MQQRSRTHIRIISPSGRFDPTLLHDRMVELEKDFKVSYHKLDVDPSWPFTAGNFHARLTQLNEALLAPDVDVILSARGGYGASDLLAHLPWSELKYARPKLLIGFSDISALHSALYTKLDWPCIHGPMPGTELWGKNDPRDIECLVKLIKGTNDSVDIPLRALNQSMPLPISGWSYGGCLAVLTNLIGTAYFPKSLWGSILFWEDIGEHPARIIRFINQWAQSQALLGVKAIVLGRFSGCEVKDLIDEDGLRAEISKRLSIPVFTTDHFGHCAPNWPLPVGLSIEIKDSLLRWNLPPLAR
jgi:muramoyltetrapeptide carboxypeptidase